MKLGRTFDPDRPHEALHLLEGGVPIEEALTRVGWTVQAAHRWAQRNNDPELLRYLRPAYAAHKRERQPA